MAGGLLKKLSRSFRKAAGISLMAAFSTACARNATPPAMPHPPIPAAAASPPAPDKPGELYAHDNAALEEGINAALKKNPLSRFKRAVVVDTDRIDMLIAMGVDQKDALALQLKEKGLNPDDDALKELAAQAEAPQNASLSKIAVTIVSPSASALGDDAGDVCVIMPARENNLDLVFLRSMLRAGMDIETTVAFLDHHEEEHCLDTFTNRSLLTSMAAELAAYSLDIAHTPLLTAHPDSLARLAASHVAEAFADSAALGGMIRAGSPLSIISATAAVRMRTAGDGVHDTGAVLFSLGEKITAMGGVEAFRALPPDDAKKIYHDNAMEAGLSSGKAMGAYLRLAYGTFNDWKKLEKTALTDPAVRQAVYTAKLTRSSLDNDPFKLTTQDEADMDDVSRWDETKALRDRALKAGEPADGGARIRAYVALQEDFRADIAAHPSDLTIAARAEKLRTLIVSTPGIFTDPVTPKPDSKSGKVTRPLSF